MDKDKALKQMVEKHHLSWPDSVAIGDSATDIKMLELVENPIAFNPESRLFKVAKSRGWPIVVERKNVIYELEKSTNGYHLR
jgi:phosphoserine phosphatase